MNKPYDQQKEEIKLFGLNATSVGRDFDVQRSIFENKDDLSQPIFVFVDSVKNDEEIKDSPEKIEDTAMPRFQPEEFDFSMVGVKPEKTKAQKALDKATQTYYSMQFTLSTSERIAELRQNIEKTKTKKRAIGIAAGLALFPVLLGASKADDINNVSENIASSDDELLVFQDYSDVNKPPQPSDDHIENVRLKPTPSTTTTSTTTTTTVPATTTTTQPPVTTTTAPILNEFSLPRLTANFRGAEIDCNGRYEFGSVSNLWLSTLVKICDDVNGVDAYTLSTLLERNKHIPQESGVSVFDSIKDGQVFNLGPNLPTLEFLGLKQTNKVINTDNSTNSNSRINNEFTIKAYRNECDVVGGEMGSSRSKTLTEYIIAMGGTSAEANGFSKLHPELAYGWSRYGDGNYCLLGNVDLSIYD